MAFWQTIQIKFKSRTQKEASKQTIRERVEAAVEERIEQLKTEDSGAEREENDYTIALDEWVKVIQEQKMKDKEKGEAAEVILRRENKIRADRHNLLQRLGNKINTNSLLLTDEEDNIEIEDISRDNSPELLTPTEVTHQAKRRRMESGSRSASSRGGRGRSEARGGSMAAAAGKREVEEEMRNFLHIGTQLLSKQLAAGTNVGEETERQTKLEKRFDLLEKVISEEREQSIKDRRFMEENLKLQDNKLSAILNAIQRGRGDLPN